MHAPEKEADLGLVLLPMRSGTLGISQSIRIPKGVDRAEGGHHAGSVGGWPDSNTAPPHGVAPPTPTPIVCPWYEGLRAAAAAALEALAKSGRSTVFFDDDGDAAEPDAGMTLDRTTLLLPSGLLPAGMPTQNKVSISVPVFNVLLCLR